MSFKLYEEPNTNHQQPLLLADVLSLADCLYYQFLSNYLARNAEEAVLVNIRGMHRNLIHSTKICFSIVVFYLPLSPSLVRRLHLYQLAYGYLGDGRASQKARGRW